MFQQNRVVALLINASLSTKVTNIEKKFKKGDIIWIQIKWHLFQKVFNSDTLNMKFFTSYSGFGKTRWRTWLISWNVPQHLILLKIYNPNSASTSGKAPGYQRLQCFLLPLSNCRETHVLTRKIQGSYSNLNIHTKCSLLHCKPCHANPCWKMYAA